MAEEKKPYAQRDLCVDGCRRSARGWVATMRDEDMDAILSLTGAPLPDMRATYRVTVEKVEW